MVIVTGTDTDVGKTLVSSWLCLHTRFSYFKPIQTGTVEGRDADTVVSLAKVFAYPEVYAYKTPVSPHLAAAIEGERIDINDIKLPTSQHVVIEGAGGVCVPLNETSLMLDLFAHLEKPLLLVASSRLGTINHTLLSIRAIRAQHLPLLGVVMVGEDRLQNQTAIEHYGQVPVLATLPWLAEVNEASLAALPLPSQLQHALGK